MAIDHLIFNRSKWWQLTSTNATVDFINQKPKVTFTKPTYLVKTEYVQKASAMFSESTNFTEYFNNWRYYPASSGYLVFRMTVNFTDIGPTLVYAYASDEAGLTYVRAVDATLTEISGG